MLLHQKWHEGEGLQRAAVDAKTFSVDLRLRSRPKLARRTPLDPRWERLGEISRRKRNPLFVRFYSYDGGEFGNYLLKKKKKLVISS